MTGAPAATTPAEPKSLRTILAIGVGQIIGWGSAFYLIAIIATPVAQETGWSFTRIIAGHALALLVAGVSAPRVGLLIETWGGRSVLALSSVLMASGLALLALSHHLSIWYAAWFLLGLAMACGLYDAAFSTLGQIFGTKARTAITNVTLFGGLASTICWPFTAYMTAHFGWRDACLAFAAIHLLVMLPVHFFYVPKVQRNALAPKNAMEEEGTEPDYRAPVTLLLALILVIAAAVAAIISVHLIALLQARGLSLAAAVATGALFGPAQVAARILERVFGGRLHAVWTLVISIVLTCLGLLMLGLNIEAGVVALALILYGAGNGINSIAKGTVPLALFGPRFYARIMGRLALPQLITQACAPALVALLMETHGSESALPVLAGLTLTNCLLVAVFVRMTRNYR
jgi:predicted MFS family arabinose efflux permease